MTKGQAPDRCAPESALCPQADAALQRVEAMARTLRETGNPEYIGRMHHGLARVRQAMPDSGPEPMDQEMRVED